MPCFVGQEAVGSLPCDEGHSGRSRETRNRAEDKTKPRKELEPEGHSSLWSSKTSVQSEEPQDGRRCHSPRNAPRAHV